MRRIDVDGTWTIDKDVTLTAGYASTVDTIADYSGTATKAVTRATDTTKQYAEGTKFIFHTTFTYRGASPASGSSSSNAAFFQFISVSSPKDSRNSWNYFVVKNNNLVTSGDKTYSASGTVGGITFELNKTYHLRFEFTVGSDYKKYSMMTYVLDDEGNVLLSTIALSNAPQQTNVDSESPSANAARTDMCYSFSIQPRNGYLTEPFNYTIVDCALVVEEPAPTTNAE